MKAVILAAGMGIRLKPMTGKLPKCLIEINGKTLLEQSLDSLKENKIKEVIIVIGFYGNLIKQRFGENYKGINLRYIENKNYSRTGSMYSLSQIKDMIDDDILLLESDLFYDQRAIKILLDSKFRNAILVAKLLNSEDDVYVVINKNNEITNLGKNIPEKDKKQAIGALVGISKFSKEFLSNLFKKAEQDYKNNKLGYPYEECVFEISKTDKLENTIYAELCKDLNWIEIDNKEDLKRAKEEIYPKLK